MLRVTVDVRSFDAVVKKLKALPDQLKNQALAAALNKTAAAGKAEMTRAITATYNVKANKVRNALYLVKASSKSGVPVLVAALEAFGSTNKKGRSLNLIHFVERSVSLAEGRRRNKSGTSKALRVRVKKAGGVKVIAGAFIGNKGRTVFIRVPEKVMSSRSKYAGTQHAHAIRPMQVIDIPQMFNQRRINQRVLTKINKQLPIEVDRAIKMVLSKQGLK